MSGTVRWSPEALALSLHLAFLLGLHEASNDNGRHVLRTGEAARKVESLPGK